MPVDPNRVWRERARPRSARGSGRHCLRSMAAASGDNGDQADTQRDAERDRVESHRSPPPLLDQREKLEHRQIHRDHDSADHGSDADHEDWLDDRGERLNARVDLVLVEIGDLAEHLVELTGLLTDLDHLTDHRREDGILGERLAHWHALLYSLHDPTPRLFGD